MRRATSLNLGIRKACHPERSEGSGRTTGPARCLHFPLRGIPTLSMTTGGRGIGVRKGLTFVELVIGMTITALIAAAVATFLVSVSRGWAYSSAVQTQSTVSSQVMLRLNKLVKDAKQIGAFRAGGISGTVTTPAAVLFWRGDLNGDDKIQFSELAVIQHDPDGDAGNEIPTDAIVYWSVQYPSAWSSAQKASNDFDISDASFYNDGEITQFITNFPDVVKPSLIARDITRLQLNRIDSSSTVRPALEYALKLTDADGVETTKYSRTTLRAPAKLATGYP